MLNGRQCAATCDEQASKRKPYEAKWAGCEERKRSLQKRGVSLCSLSKKEYGRTYKSEIIAMTRVRTTFSVVDTAHLAFSNTLTVAEGMITVTSENKIDE